MWLLENLVTHVSVGLAGVSSQLPHLMCVLIREEGDSSRGAPFQLLMTFSLPLFTAPGGPHCEAKGATREVKRLPLRERGP